MPQVKVDFSNREGSRSGATYTNATSNPAPDGLGIHVGSAISLRRQTEIISAIDLLLSHLRNRAVDLEDPATVVAAVNINKIAANNVRFNVGLAEVTFGTSDVAVSIDAGVNLGYISPMNTAFETMKKVLLENIKDQLASDVDPTNNMPGLNSITPNVYQVTGDWPAGTQCAVHLEVTDSQGDTDVTDLVITLPTAMSAAQTATYVASEVDQVAFVGAVASGTTVTLSPTEPGNTLVSSASVVA